MFILSVNFVLPLIREVAGGVALPPPAIIVIAALVLVPLCLFGFVLYPARRLAEAVELGDRPVRHSYFVVRERYSLPLYLDDVAATDWPTELGFEIMKLARLRELKRRRLLRALIAAAIAYALMLVVMLVVAS